MFGMVVRVYVFETRGGALLAEVEPVQVSWGVQANTADDVSVTVDLNSTVEGSRDWRNLGTPWKHSLAVDVGGRVYGGPIMPHDFGEDDGRLTLAARGLLVALDRRSVLQLAALTTSLVDGDGLPDPAFDTTIAGFDLGTIGKKVVVQALTWPGWSDVPVVFHADRAGTRTRTYVGVERKPVAEALDDLSGVQNGPDIRFQLRWTGPDTFGWLYESGTETQPRLQGESVFSWEVGQESGLTVSTNPSRMGSVAWSQGGRADDAIAVAMMYDSFLVDRGFPLLELESDASSTTSSQDTLVAWNVETLRTARVPWEFWSFRVRADRSPFPNEYNTGDLIDVIVTADTPVAGGYVPVGAYRRRIAGLSDDESGEFITITCGETYG